MYLRESLVATSAARCEQSLPPYPLLQAQVAVHVVSNSEHDRRELPEGSVYRHTPFVEHTVPVKQFPGSVLSCVERSVVSNGALLWYRRLWSMYLDYLWGT